MRSVIDQIEDAQCGPVLHRRLHFPTEKFPFDQAVKLYVEQGLGNSISALSECHLSPAVDALLRTEGFGFKKPISEVSKLLVDMFRNFVNFISTTEGFSLLYEFDPVLRINPPQVTPDRFILDDGTSFAFHIDPMLGDPFYQVNCWLPICGSSGSASLRIAPISSSIACLRSFYDTLDQPERDFGSSRANFFEAAKEGRIDISDIQRDSTSVEIDFGELLLFDPRILHSTTVNETAFTRISIDFRIIPITEKLADQLGGSARLREVIFHWENNGYARSDNFIEPTTNN